MNKLEAEKKAYMDDAVGQKLAAAEASIQDLKYNYETNFTERLDEQEPDLDQSTKDNVIQKLKNKKNNFFAAIWDIRQVLGVKL